MKNDNGGIYINSNDHDFVTVSTMFYLSHGLWWLAQVEVTGALGRWSMQDDKTAQIVW